jgi:hypothetical protein
MRLGTGGREALGRASAGRAGPGAAPRLQGPSRRAAVAVKALAGSAGASSGFMGRRMVGSVGLRVSRGAGRDAIWGRAFARGPRGRPPPPHAPRLRGSASAIPTLAPPRAAGRGAARGGAPAARGRERARAARAHAPSPSSHRPPPRRRAAAPAAAHLRPRPRRPRPHPHQPLTGAAARRGPGRGRVAVRAMFERFTEKAIKVVMLAQEEARRLGHNFVGTEQVLLGLIGESTGIAAKVLKSMGVNLKDARTEVEKIIGRGSGFVAVEIPFTPRAKRVLELSLEEARQLGASARAAGGGRRARAWRRGRARGWRLAARLRGPQPRAPSKPRPAPPPPPSQGHNYIGTEHILLGLLREGEGVAARVLETLGADPSKIRTQVIRMVGESQEAVGAAAGSGSGGTNKMPTLEEYGTNLTRQAEEGKLDPVVVRGGSGKQGEGDCGPAGCGPAGTRGQWLPSEAPQARARAAAAASPRAAAAPAPLFFFHPQGRKKEIQRVIQILGRRTKNNPCLIGEPGVGKTAVAEGLAQLIASGDVPETIEGKQVVTLDMGLLVAGTKYRGEFEERLKKLMDEIKQNDDIILVRRWGLTWG